MLGPSPQFLGENSRPTHVPFTKVLSLSLPSWLPLAGPLCWQGNSGCFCEGFPILCSKVYFQEFNHKCAVHPRCSDFHFCFSLLATEARALHTLGNHSVSEWHPASFSYVLIPPPKDCTAYRVYFFVCLSGLVFTFLLESNKLHQWGISKVSSAIPGLGPRSPGSGWAHSACLHHSS